MHPNFILNTATRYARAIMVDVELKQERPASVSGSVGEAKIISNLVGKDIVTVIIGDKLATEDALVGLENSSIALNYRYPDKGLFGVNGIADQRRQDDLPCSNYSRASLHHKSIVRHIKDKSGVLANGLDRTKG